MSTDAKTRFLAAVRNFITQHDLLPRTAAPGVKFAGRAAIARGGARPAQRTRREPLVVGVSGGPDSVALLLALAQLAETDFAIRPVVAHLHHGLRGRAADADRNFVRSLARRLRLRFITRQVDVRRLARSLGVGLEEAGRTARRQFLAQVARRVGARRIALGHNADDRAETVLFNILRGTGLAGLAAPLPRSPLTPSDEYAPQGCTGHRPREMRLEIIRPLLSVARADVLAYLATEGQDFRRDRSNASRAFARNRLRHELLPLVRRRFNPRAAEALARLSDQAAAAAEVLADAMDETWRRIVRQVRRTAILIDADDFASLRPWMQGAILRRAVQRLGGGLKHMSAERTRQTVAALLASPAAGPVPLPGGLAALRRRGIIRIGQRRAARTPQP